MRLLARAAASPTLIGREDELGRVRRLIRRDDVRLVTLVGTAGVGKTRLAVEAGAGLVERFEHGVAFIDLATLTQPDWVAPAIARALGIKEPRYRTGRSSAEDLAVSLGSRRLLLVLDNVEHVIAAATDIATIIAACPGLQVLATSREPLRVYGEHLVQIDPLAAPPADVTDPDQLVTFPSVALLVERARAADDTFAITESNARSVARLCTRLDGLPLAIELAATRLRAMGPDALLARLDQRLDVLAVGPRGHPPRQQTLRGAITWSYNLLDPAEQATFRRLGVFAGAFTPEAAEAVVRDSVGPTDALGEHLAALADKSLLQTVAQPGQAPRLRMLQTIREHAVERLTDSGELSTLRRRHAEHYVELVERADDRLRGPEQMAWLARLDAEQDDVRAALLLCQQTPECRDLGHRFGAALTYYWWVRAAFGEGCRWLASLLGPLAEASQSTPTSESMSRVRPALDRLGDRVLLDHAGDNRSAPARALAGAAFLSENRGEHDRAVAQAERALDLGRDAGDGHAVAWASAVLGLVTRNEGEYAESRAYFAASLTLWRAIGSPWGVAVGLWWLGTVAWFEGQYEHAAVLLEESLAHCRQVGDDAVTARVLRYLGYARHVLGDDRRADVLLRDSLDRCRRLGHREGVAATLNVLGEVAGERGRGHESARLHGEGLVLAYEVGGRGTLIRCLEGLATFAHSEGRSVRAARLFGAAAGLRDRTDSPGLPTRGPRHGPTKIRIRSLPQEPGFGAAWDAGRSLALDEVVEDALRESAHGGVARPPERRSGVARRAVEEVPGGQAVGALPASIISRLRDDRASALTPREREVASLIARGLTNRQVAQRLVIAEGTVETHVARVLRKLGLRSRTQVAAWAFGGGRIGADGHATEENE